MAQNVLSLTTVKKNRQTQLIQQINLSFKMTAVDGVARLELKENDGAYRVASKSDVTKYRKEVIQDILVNLCGYHDIDQRKSDLEKILYSFFDIEQHPSLVIDRVLTPTIKQEMVAELANHHPVLCYDILKRMQNHHNCNHKEDELTSITSFLEDLYVHLYRSCFDVLEAFCIMIWTSMIIAWSAHPLDDAFTKSQIKFLTTFHGEEPYKLLQTEYVSVILQSAQSAHVGKHFGGFAFGIWRHIRGIFTLELLRLFGRKVIGEQRLSAKGKALSSEELYYLQQSMGGATVNSLLRLYYGGNYRRNRRTLLLQMVKSLLLTAENVSNQRVAFRLNIENRGFMRLIHEQCTRWVGIVLSLMEKQMSHLILRHKGDFKCIEQIILQHLHCKNVFMELFDLQKVQQAFEQTISEQTESDAESKDEDLIQSTLFADLYGECLEKVFQDFVHGLVNRKIWGYLKQMKPDPKEHISLRNKLKLTLYSDAKKTSSLQVHN